jgi:Subtilase family
VAVLSAVAPAAVHAVYPAQPYLAQIGRPPLVPPLRPVKVAIVDTAVDAEHPDLAGRIVAARAFGGGDPRYPASPHGTAVAGLIGAIDGNGIGDRRNRSEREAARR